MMAAARQREIPGGWLGSVVLHGALLAAALFAWPKHDMQGGTVVPVKILTNAAETNLRPAIEAPDVQTAQTEDPAPQAPLETVAPTPDPAPPTPAPPRPTPTPKVAPKTPPTPAPKTPAPKAAPQKTTPPQKAQPTPSLDLAELRRELGVRPSGGRRSSAPKGQNRPETDRVARPDAGEGLSASSVPGLQEQLSELWNPNCQVQGGRSARVVVTFVVGPGGRLMEKPTAGGQEFTTGVPRVAAERAINAVEIAEDRGHLAMVPRSLHGKKITARFDPSQCS